MKLTKSKLKQLIKEEIEQIVQEDEVNYPGTGAQTSRSHDFNLVLNDILVVVQRIYIELKNRP